jgi:hypothetical protein
MILLMKKKRKEEDVIMDEINHSYNDRCEIPSKFDDSFNLNIYKDWISLLENIYYLFKSLTLLI